MTPTPTGVSDDVGIGGSALLGIAVCWGVLPAWLIWQAEKEDKSKED